MSARKVTAQTMSAEQLATAVRRLRYVLADANQIAAFMFVCIEALRAQRKSEVDADVATVLETAFEKMLFVRTTARDALAALGQEAGPMANSYLKPLPADHSGVRHRRSRRVSP